MFSSHASFEAELMETFKSLIQNPAPFSHASFEAELMETKNSVYLCQYIKLYSHASFEAELMETSTHLRVMEISTEGSSHASFEAELMETVGYPLGQADPQLPRFL